MRASSGANDASDRLERDIPQRIRRLRDALGLSATMLDSAAGFRQGTSGRLERGEQRVYGSHLYRISAATGVAIGWFYTESGEDASPTTHMEHEQRRLLEVYLRIRSPALRRDVFELVQSLAEQESA